MNKTKLLFTSILSLGLIVSCKTPLEKSRYNAASPTNNVTLNLTSIGLYNEEVGTLDKTTFIEYAKVLTLSPGDSLPNEEITCTSPNMKFVSWSYVKFNAGLPSYTDKVVEGVSIYQAVFESTIDLMEGEDTPLPTPDPENPDNPDNPVNLVTYYFIDQSWWNTGAASSYIYLWNSNVKDSHKVDWPGEKMKHIIWDEATKTNTWSFDIDFDKYDRCIISRRSGDGKEDWGAQTKDISLDKDKNAIILSSTAAWYENGNGKAADFTLSIVNIK